MKKKLFYSIIVFLFAFMCNNFVYALEMSLDEIDNSTYVIGTHMFTRNTNENYGGQLTTKYIMLATKTIDGNTLDDMIIYYKTARGVWVDPLTNEQIEMPEKFDIRYKDTKSVEAGNYVVTFDSNGGSEIDPLTVEENKTVKAPTEPTKTGYTFIEWQLNNVTYDFSTPITKDITLKAVWHVNSYSIKYDKNAEDAVGEMEDTGCTYGSYHILSKNTYTRENYTFVGWSTTPNGDVEYTDEKLVSNLTSEDNAEVTLYAIWLADAYNIEYTLNEGTATNPTLYSAFNLPITLNNPTKEGYIFTGWTGSNGETPQTEVTIEEGTTGKLNYIANWQLVGDINNDEKVDAGDTTLVRQYIAGTEEFTEIQELVADVNKDTEIDYIDVEIMRKYITGDHGVEKLPYDSGEKYSISYELNSGSIDESDYNITKYASISLPFTLNNPTKEGYIFAGWTGSNGDTPQTEVTIEEGTTGDLTYTANWINLGDVNNDGSISKEDEQLIHDYVDEYELAPTAVIDAGDVNSDGDVDDVDAAIIHAYIYGKLSGISPHEYESGEKYTISYDLTGGSVTKENRNIKTYAAISLPFTLNNPTREGYVFTGWTGSNGDTPQTEVTIEEGTTENLTYTANWTPVTYKIFYVPTMSYSGETMDDTICTYDQECELLKNTYTKEGYTFIGWSTTENGEVEYEDEATVKNLTTENNGEVELYTVWEAEMYTISYELNDGEATNPEAYTADSETFTLVNPTKEGYVFTGWTGSNGDTPQTEVTIETGSTGNLSYTANWTPISYMIVYNSNATDATGTMENTICNYNENCQLTINSYERENYLFAGWTTTKTGEVEYADEESVKNLTSTNNEEVILYAVWEVIWLVDASGTIIEYNGNEEEVIIPEKINALEIVSIGANAFTSSTMKKLTLSSNITTIQSGAILKENNPSLREIYLTDEQYNSAPSGDWIGVLGVTAIKKYDTDNVTNTLKYATADDVITLYNIEFIYNITYELNGGTATDNPTQYFKYGEDITLNNPTKEGYTFTGWTGSNGETPATEVTIESETIGDLNYTANWRENTWSIALVYGYGGVTTDEMDFSEVDYSADPYCSETGSMNDYCTYTYTQEVTIPVNKVKREGYTFAGWATTADLTSPDGEPGPIVYQGGEKVSKVISRDQGVLTLYAVWTENETQSEE